ncbi:MAG: VCBS repeat-containing protein [Candidatus Lokiarchaeota archaeon]|nr:VCBS repeat-containing protein [Candidatus Harpocratesius repetitus]
MKEMKVSDEMNSIMKIPALNENIKKGHGAWVSTDNYIFSLDVWGGSGPDTGYITLTRTNNTKSEGTTIKLGSTWSYPEIFWIDGLLYIVHTAKINLGTYARMVVYTEDLEMIADVQLSSIQWKTYWDFYVAKLDNEIHVLAVQNQDFYHFRVSNLENENGANVETTFSNKGNYTSALFMGDYLYISGQPANPVNNEKIIYIPSILGKLFPIKSELGADEIGIIIGQTNISVSKSNNGIDWTTPINLGIDMVDMAWNENEVVVATNNDKIYYITDELSLQPFNLEFLNIPVGKDCLLYFQDTWYSGVEIDIGVGEDPIIGQVYVLTSEWYLDNYPAILCKPSNYYYDEVSLYWTGTPFGYYELERSTNENMEDAVVIYRGNRTWFHENWTDLISNENEKVTFYYTVRQINGQFKSNRSEVFAVDSDNFKEFEIENESSNKNIPGYPNTTFLATLIWTILALYTYSVLSHLRNHKRSKSKFLKKFLIVMLILNSLITISSVPHSLLNIQYVSATAEGDEIADEMMGSSLVLPWIAQVPGNPIFFEAGNLDGDSDLEIITGGNLNIGYEFNLSHILIYDHDGTPLTQYFYFPYYLLPLRNFTSAYPGDVDGDGRPEIFFGTSDKGTIVMEYMGKSDGDERLPEWIMVRHDPSVELPVRGMSHQGAVWKEDIDKDGLQDICIASCGKITMISGSGEKDDEYEVVEIGKSESSTELGSIYWTDVGNLDNDPELEVVFSEYDTIKIMDYDEAQHKYNTILVQSLSEWKCWAYYSIALGNFDGKGSDEIFIQYQGNHYYEETEFTQSGFGVWKLVQDDETGKNSLELIWKDDFYSASTHSEWGARGKNNFETIDIDGDGKVEITAHRSDYDSGELRIFEYSGENDDAYYHLKFQARSYNNYIRNEGMNATYQYSNLKNVGLGHYAVDCDGDKKSELFTLTKSWVVIGGISIGSYEYSSFISMMLDTGFLIEAWKIYEKPKNIVGYSPLIFVSSVIFSFISLIGLIHEFQRQSGETCQLRKRGIKKKKIDNFNK